jgi:hypothetical protein
MFKALDFDYCHFGPPKGGFAHYTFECFHEYDSHSGPTVFDRSHLGEQIYGPIYRSKDTLGPTPRRLLEAYLKGRGAIVILAVPKKDVAKGLWEARAADGGEMYTDRWERQYDAFNTSLITSLPVLRYDWTQESLMSLMDRYWAALRYWYGRRTV